MEYNRHLDYCRNRVLEGKYCNHVLLVPGEMAVDENVVDEMVAVVCSSYHYVQKQDCYNY